jgi:hypothetical protein
MKLSMPPGTLRGEPHIAHKGYVFSNVERGLVVKPSLRTISACCRSIHNSQFTIHDCFRIPRELESEARHRRTLSGLIVEAVSTDDFSLLPLNSQFTIHNSRLLPHPPENSNLRPSIDVR